MWKYRKRPLTRPPNKLPQVSARAVSHNNNYIKNLIRKVFIKVNPLIFTLKTAYGKRQIQWMTWNMVTWSSLPAWQKRGIFGAKLILPAVRRMLLQQHKLCLASFHLSHKSYLWSLSIFAGYSAIWREFSWVLSGITGSKFQSSSRAPSQKLKIGIWDISRRMRSQLLTSNTMYVNFPFSLAVIMTAILPLG